MNDTTILLICLLAAVGVGTLIAWVANAVTDRRPAEPPDPRPIWYTPSMYRERFGSGPCWAVMRDPMDVGSDPVDLEICYYTDDDQLFRLYGTVPPLSDGDIRAVQPIQTPVLPR